ncbi:MAG: hypothetical protein L0229_03310 [Blastocatellia bacterium]|nr:hypothetical protein [Blastocatellia bacterium]
MDDKEATEKYSPNLSRLKKIFVVLTALWLAFSLAQESISFFSSPLLRVDVFIIYAFSIPITLWGTVLPLLLAVWLCWMIKLRLKSDGVGRSVYEAIKVRLEGIIGVVIFIVMSFVVVSFPAYLFIEDFMAFSVLPLTTPVCSILGAFIGYCIFRRVKIDNRPALLALLICSILATEYLDWNPRKPLLRNLYRIRVGMTVAEVEQIMDGHIKGFGLPDNLARDFKDEDGPIMYRADWSAAYNSDFGWIEIKDGKVEDVWHDHD